VIASLLFGGAQLIEEGRGARAARRLGIDRYNRQNLLGLALSDGGRFFCELYYRSDALETAPSAVRIARTSPTCWEVRSSEPQLVLKFFFEGKPS
jgi:hypothetical protein